MSKFKNFYETNAMFFKNIALGVSVTIACLNFYFFFTNSDMLYFYVPTTIFGLICVFYGTYGRKSNKKMTAKQ